MSDVIARIDRQRAARLAAPHFPGLKINLYRGYEVEGVARALADNPELGRHARVESVMVADSYLMTHLGRSSTILSAASEQQLFLDVMVSLVAEAAAAMAGCFAGRDAPYLVADMPDGAAETSEDALRNAGRMLRAGADVVKIEVTSDARCTVIEALTAAGVPVMAHLGYTPQGGHQSRVGRTADELLDLFARARRVRDAGATSLVIEKVSRLANELLSRPDPAGLKTYAIFSGRAANGGQSLNVWDSVFRAPANTRFFPPTGTRDRGDYPAAYTAAVIADHMARLMRMTVDGVFPRDPAGDLDAALEAELREITPWADQATPLRPVMAGAAALAGIA